MQFNTTSTGTMNTDLSKRTSLVSLRVSIWNASKKDRKGNAIIADQLGSDQRMRRVQKSLIDPDAIKPLSNIAANARGLHYAKTLPWLDEGVRIIPTALLIDYDQAIGDCKREFLHAVSRFISNYPTHLAVAQHLHGRDFDESEYPTQEQLARKFGFGVSYLPVPEVADFRCDVPDGLARMMRESMEAEMRGVMELAVVDVTSRVREVVGRMVDRLDAYTDARTGGRGMQPGDFKQAMIDNIGKLATIIPALNIGDNARITEICNDMQRLTLRSAEELKSNPITRKTVADEAEAIMSKLSAWGY